MGSSGLIEVHYISTSRIDAAAIEAGLAAIIRRSVEHNRRNAITGGLIYAQGLFSQVLEGPAAATDALMARIARDSRHRDCTIVARRSIEARRFANWSMGYNGASVFVEDTMKRACAGARRGSAADTGTLVRMMAAFAAASPVPLRG